MPRECIWTLVGLFLGASILCFNPGLIHCSASLNCGILQAGILWGPSLLLALGGLLLLVTRTTQLDCARDRTPESLLRLNDAPEPFRPISSHRLAHQVFRL